MHCFERLQCKLWKKASQLPVRGFQVLEDLPICQFADVSMVEHGYTYIQCGNLFVK
jgi:hypothetical protein